MIVYEISSFARDLLNKQTALGVGWPEHYCIVWPLHSRLGVARIPAVECPVFTVLQTG